MKGERTRFAKYSAHLCGPGGFSVGMVGWAGFWSCFSASASASASASLDRLGRRLCQAVRALDDTVSVVSISASGSVCVT